MNSAITPARHIGRQNNYALPASEIIDDWLHGATQIAHFLFGDGSQRSRRRVYYLVENGLLPVLHLAGLRARKSTLLAWLEQSERNAVWSVGEVLQ